jgi:hypothetical protein
MDAVPSTSTEKTTTFDGRDASLADYGSSTNALGLVSAERGARAARAHHALSTAIGSAVVGQVPASLGARS